MKSISTIRTALAVAIQQRLLGKAQRARRSQFDQFLPPKGRVLFLGDSITEGGLWEEWFPDLRPVNRGIGGETAAQVLTRVDGTINEPRAVFLLIGTNDLAMGFPVQQIAGNVAKIVLRIRELAPDAPIYIQSVMPRGAKWRDRVQALNKAFRTVASLNSVTFIDLWPGLEGRHGALKPEYTFDDVHLTGLGYRSWANMISPYLAQTG